MSTRVQRYRGTTLSLPHTPPTPQPGLAKRELTGTFSSCRDCSGCVVVSRENFLRPGCSKLLCTASVPVMLITGVRNLSP